MNSANFFELGKKYLLFCAALFLFPVVGVANVPLDESRAVARIGFGSCLHQDYPQPIWDAVDSQNPHLFLFVGDNIYVDSTKRKLRKRGYKRLSENPGFARLRSKTPLMATWDDHDYGMNDAGAEFPAKEESEETFLDFWNEPLGSERRKRAGVYDAKIFGPSGKRVQVILLDTRYFRSALINTGKEDNRADGTIGWYEPNYDKKATMLGERQWQWFARQLKKPAELRLIVSSVQVLSNQVGTENWAALPLERERLFKILRRSKAKGVVLLSGDRHFAELARIDGVLPYPLYELTSSALNVPKTWWHNDVNPYRVGLTYFATNFGIVDVLWGQEDPSVILQIFGEKGGLKIRKRLKLSDLK